MTRFHFRLACAALCALPSLTLAPKLTAQAQLPERITAPLLVLELARPFSMYIPSGLAVSLDATLAIPVFGETTAMFLRMGAAFEGHGSVTGGAFSRPRLGVQTGRGWLLSELHVDLPARSDPFSHSALGTATASDAEGGVRFSERYWSVGGSLAGATQIGETTRARLRGGLEAWLPDEDGLESEFQAMLALIFEIPVQSVLLEAGLSSISLLTAQGGGGHTRLYTHLTATLSNVSARPALFLRLSVNDAARQQLISGGSPADIVLGARLTMGG